MSGEDEKRRQLDQAIGNFPPEVRRFLIVGVAPSHSMSALASAAGLPYWEEPIELRRQAAGQLAEVLERSYEERVGIAHRRMYGGFEVEPIKPRPMSAARAMALGTLREDPEAVARFAEEWGHKPMSKRAQRRARGKRK